MSPTRSSRRRVIAATCPTIRWRSSRLRSRQAKVKEFSPGFVTKLLARRPTSGMLWSLRKQPAAPAARSWVGRVRVVGAADVIDALTAWQKSPLRRTIHRDSIGAVLFGGRLRTLCPDFLPGIGQVQDGGSGSSIGGRSGAPVISRDPRPRVKNLQAQRTTPTIRLGKPIRYRMWIVSHRT